MGKALSFHGIRKKATCQWPCFTAAPQGAPFSFFRIPAGTQTHLRGPAETPARTLLSAAFSGSQLRAAFGAAGGQDLAAVAALAAGQKAVLRGAVALLGLECTFHKKSSSLMEPQHLVVPSLLLSRKPSLLAETALQHKSITEKAALCQHFSAFFHPPASAAGGHARFFPSACFKQTACGNAIRVFYIVNKVM